MTDHNEERARLDLPAQEPARIDVGLLRPRDIELVMHEYENGEPKEIVYVIRGNLPTEVMIAMFDLEDRIKALDESNEEHRRPLIEICDEVNGLVLELVQDRYPEVETLNFGVEESLGVLAFIAQNRSVAHEVASALTGSGTRKRPPRQPRDRQPPRRRTTKS